MRMREFHSRTFEMHYSLCSMKLAHSLYHSCAHPSSTLGLAVCMYSRYQALLPFLLFTSSQISTVQTMQYFVMLREKSISSFPLHISPSLLLTSGSDRRPHSSVQRHDTYHAEGFSCQCSKSSCEHSMTYRIAGKFGRN